MIMKLYLKTFSQNLKKTNTKKTFNLIFNYSFTWDQRLSCISISLILFFANSIYFSSNSIPMYLLLFIAHATPVVPLPLKGSKTKSFSFVVDSKILVNSSKGFWVGCFPNDFSL